MTTFTVEDKKVLSFNMFKQHLHDVLNNIEDEASPYEILTYKCAIAETERIQELLNNDIITEDEINDILIHPQRYEDILNNI